LFMTLFKTAYHLITGFRARLMQSTDLQSNFLTFISILTSRLCLGAPRSCLFWYSQSKFVKCFLSLILFKPIPVAALSKAWVCGLSLAAIAGSNPAGGHGCLSVVNVVWCQVDFSASGLSLVQRSPTHCGVSLCVIVKLLVDTNVPNFRPDVSFSLNQKINTYTANVENKVSS
jgi:hypothetical protein